VMCAEPEMVVIRREATQRTTEFGSILQEVTTRA
jgi:hypothetical protein